MLKRIPISFAMLVVALLFSAPLYSNSEADSLLRMLPAAEDSSRVDLLYALSEATSGSDQTASRNYLIKGVGLADRMQNQQAVAQGYRLLAQSYQAEKQDSKAIQYWKKALPIYEVHDDFKQQADLWYEIGNCYLNLGNLGTAIAYFERSFNLANLGKYYEGMGNAYSSLGAVHTERGDFAQASTYLRIAIELHGKANNEKKQAAAHSALGVLNLQLKRFEQAIASHQQALHLFEVADDAMGQAKSRENLGRVYQHKGDDTLAIRYYTEALYYYARENHIKGFADIMSARAKMLADAGEDERAWKKYEEASVLFDSIGDQKGICKNLNLQALLLTKSKEFQKAETLGMKALQIARELRSSQLAEQTNETLYNLYNSWGKADRALIYLRQYALIRDSVRALNLRHEVTHIQLSDNLQAQEEENRLLKRSRAFQQSIITEQNASERRQLIATISVSAAFIALLLLAFVLLKIIRKSYRQNRRLTLQNVEITQQKSEIESQNSALGSQNREIRKQRTEIEAQQAEILNVLARLREKEEQLLNEIKVKQSLLQEIHHRVKNNLQVISSLLNLQSNYVKDHQTLEVIRESINRIRSMALIHQSLYQQKDFVRSDFAKYVEELAHNLIETYQNESCTVELAIEVEKMLLSLDDSVPCGLILNELISNALKYAFVNKSEGTVTVRMEQHEDHYVLEVRDNGIGFPENFKPEETDSLGIELVQTLAEQLDGELTMVNREGAYIRVSWPVVEEVVHEDLRAPTVM